MAKFIQITSQQGFVYKVPAEVIAASRAKYYEDDPDSSYQEEYDYTLGSNYELSDWFSNNMNWEDVQEHAILVSSPTKDEPVVGQDETEIIDE